MLLVEHDMDAVFALADRLTGDGQWQRAGIGHAGAKSAPAPRCREAYLGTEEFHQ